MPKILIVEDGTVASDNLRGVFAAAEVEPVFVQSTSEALQQYTKGGFDLVLTEVRMAVMDGILLARKIRQVDPDAVVICMTALQRKDDLLRAIREGVFDFFVKPFAAHEMTVCLRRAVAHRERIAMGRNAGAGSPEVSAPDPEWIRQLAERETALKQGEAALESALTEFEAMNVGMAPGMEPSAMEAREAALSKREQSLLDRESLVEEREAFLEESENALFDKGQHLQELETELDHRAEGLGPVPASELSHGSNSEADAAALETRRAALDERERELEKRFGLILEREKRLKKNEALIRAREQYLRESENILFKSED